MPEKNSIISNSQNRNGDPKITFETIQNYYSKIQSDGVNTDTIMLYGYFFTNDNQERLNKALIELKKMNFDFVDIHQDESKIYWLHVERKEMHNAKSLFDLNKDLYAIADKYNLESYDGFDMGNADSTKAIQRNESKTGF